MTTFVRNHAGMNNTHGGTHVATTGFPQQPQPPHYQRKSRQQFVQELSQCLLDFVLQLLPTPEELAVKEDVRKLLERLIRTIEPESRLLSFGSTANGFSLRNSDMDLCCLIDSEERLSATDLVTMVGDLLERETKFHVKPLPHARIPIVKLSLDPSPGLPLGIACDIGFENRLALENTRLLFCYAMVDPARIRTMVLFLKVWSKQRKINSPYKGTLSSYGYVLLVIYFLVHVKNPPILPNLQQIPPLHPIPPEEYHMGGRNIWFFDDIELLRQRWQSNNQDSVAELLIDFFRYFARDFSYNTGVASIRAGLLKKDSKGWQNDNDPRFKDARERNRLCIEDPFETNYNVARCVTKDGLYLIRGEFMRASRILASRPDPASHALAELCEERGEDEWVQVSPAQAYVPPRLSIPPQTPYTVVSSPLKPKTVQFGNKFPPPSDSDKVNGNQPLPLQAVANRSPPEHMAPKRAKWTSPPPPEAPDDARIQYESRLGLGLSLATAATDAREQEKAYLSSSSNSEILSDDDKSPSDIAPDDDVRSVHSFAGETNGQRGSGLQCEPVGPSSVPHRLSDGMTGSPVASSSASSRALMGDNATPTPGARGRRVSRTLEFPQPLPPVVYPRAMEYGFNHHHHLALLEKGETARRSVSGPPRVPNAPSIRLPHRHPHVAAGLTFGTMGLSGVGVNGGVVPMAVPLPPSPVHTSAASSPTVYYETQSPTQARRGSALTPLRVGSSSNGQASHRSSPNLNTGSVNGRSGGSGGSRTSSPVNPLMTYQQHFHPARIQGQQHPGGQHHQHQPYDLLGFLTSQLSLSERMASKPPGFGFALPTQMNAQASSRLQEIQPSPSRSTSSHSHSHSNSTIIAPTTPLSSTHFRFTHVPPVTSAGGSTGDSDQASPTPSPSRTRFPHNAPSSSPSASRRQSLAMALAPMAGSTDSKSCPPPPSVSRTDAQGESIRLSAPGSPSPTSSSSSRSGSVGSASPSSSLSPRSVDFGSPESLELAQSKKPEATAPPVMGRDERAPEERVMEVEDAEEGAVEVEVGMEGVLMHLRSFKGGERAVHRRARAEVE